MNVAVLASGSGTNLQSLIDSAARGELGPARLVVVGVNVSDCGALARARAAGLATFIVDHRDFAARDDFDRALLAALDAYAVELVVLAGFMRLLGADFLARYRGRVVNIHPALLPAFPGVHGQRQAFAYGVKISGCTVHFVDDGVDSGAVIAQAAVPVLDDDDEPALSARILAEEHRLLPAVVRALAEGRVSAEGRRVRVQRSRPSADSLRTL
ncbi:MAG TPA: phosphoribosylglycinamide formyltransferase [Polyangia bacterium]|jgi:phosphoribosylglycinamide formyltransferase-1|nr:phosphoribosylglycinamide formyltransferase [Polyangia bacterium]